MPADLQLIALAIFAAALVLVAAAAVVVIVKRRKGVSLSEVYWKGSTIFRRVNLEQLVLSPAGNYARVIALLGTFLFCVAVMIVIAGSFL